MRFGFSHDRTSRSQSRIRKKMRCRLAMVALTAAGFVEALPRYETSDKGLAAGKGDYFHANGDQVAMESAAGANVTEGQGGAVDRPPRFGFPTYTQDVQTVGNAVPGLYGPVKLDIGGLVLGTIIGLGAFFILPKLFHVVSTPYGGYKRSEDQPGATDGGIGDLLDKIQDGLNAYNIDSTACLQRAVCFSVQSADQKTGNNTANGLETAVNNVAKNDAVKTLIDGTEWRKAVDVAERGEDCSSAFPKCPVEVDTIISGIAKYFTT